jgi:hypothetical protein
LQTLRTTSYARYKYYLSLELFPFSAEFANYFVKTIMYSTLDSEARRMLGLEKMVLGEDDSDSAAWHPFTLGQKHFGYLFIYLFPHQWCLHLIVVVEFERS